MTKEPSIADRKKNIIRAYSNQLMFTNIGSGAFDNSMDLFKSELHSLLEAYAKEQREICADKAEIKEYASRVRGDNTAYTWEVDRDSIRNAPSPLTEKQ